jgi:hypothetical protein
VKFVANVKGVRSKAGFGDGGDKVPFRGDAMETVTVDI